jgi:hypothetical protein
MFTTKMQTGLYSNIFYKGGGKEKLKGGGTFNTFKNRIKRLSKI